jgi:hypothetical protein
MSGMRSRQTIRPEYDAYADLDTRVFLSSRRLRVGIARWGLRWVRPDIWLGRRRIGLGRRYRDGGSRSGGRRRIERIPATIAKGLHNQDLVTAGLRRKLRHARQLLRRDQVAVGEAA